VDPSSSDPAGPVGLTSAEVAERIADGRANVGTRSPSRTTAQILRANVFNPVNAIMLTLFALIMISGFWRDGLFVGVVVSNTVIGIAQELKARRELQRLELLNAPKALVIRDGQRAEVAVEEIVADDLCELVPGDQVVVDGEVVASIGLELDESLLTGESDTVIKSPGDAVLSGSFVVAGSGMIRATGVGAESYANQLTLEATRFKLVNSELRAGINTILRWLIIIIPPASLLLLWSLLGRDDPWQEGVQGTVAAAVAMVPDGLVLLTSLAFVAGVIALARRQALAKELATVELLARVDTLCLDKTGTITTGEISFGGVVPLGDTEMPTAMAAVAAVAWSDPTPNPTMAAVITGIEPLLDEPYRAASVIAVEPFSSARKWAGVAHESGDCYWLGAPELLLEETDQTSRERLGIEAAAGRRVLALVAGRGTDPARLASERQPLALILLEDTVRPDAEATLRFFTEQHVDLRIISGDNVATVAAVAERAGVPGTEHRIDARELPEDPDELARILETTVVFGRVTPHQKRAMVHALQASGRTVAMTGDGVNDVLALKDADMGIAMGSGSSASRSVADLVLLDSRFSSFPSVLAQGRKVINNIERVSNLFVTKAVYAVLLTAIIGLVQAPFPLLPRHLTLIGTFSIGVPGFFLALAPNQDLVRPGFLRRVLAFSIPAGLAAGTAALVIYGIARRDTGIDLEQARSATAITLLAVGLVILLVVSRPLRWWKIALAAAMGLSYAAVIAIAPLSQFFEMEMPPSQLWLPMVVLVAIAGFVVVVAGLLVLNRRTPR